MDAGSDPPDPRRVNERVGFVPTIAVATFLNVGLIVAGVIGMSTRAPWTGVALAACVLLAIVLIRVGIRQADRSGAELESLCRFCVLLNLVVLVGWLLTALTSLVASGR